MFCGLIGRKFSSKCKRSVKCIKCRMETIRKKKQAMVRCLKKDVADLIAGGHETNAFGRIDALMVEINQSSCYDMIEQYCCCILEHLPTMQKERVCPKETVGTIATLIFAAARFPDLPELADLRNVFTKKYGTHMEAYINEEFIEKMQKKSFSQEKKLQLMQDIAREFSVLWDFKAFEYKTSNPSAPTLDKAKIQFPSNNENLKHPVVKKVESLSTSYQVSDMQKKQLKSEELINTENIKEYQKIIQMRRYHHHLHGSAEKFNEVAADELEKEPLNVNTKGQKTGERSECVHEGLGSIGVERQSADSMDSWDAKAVNRIPPYTKFPMEFNGTSTNQTDYAHSTIPEVFKGIDHIVQGSQPNRTMNPGSNRAFNLKPPYVKPKVTKSTSMEIGYAKPTKYELSNGGNYLMNPPYCSRRTYSYSDSVVEDANLFSHIPIKQASAISKKKSMDGDDNDHQDMILSFFKGTEADATNGAIFRHRHLHRAFSDRQRLEAG